MLRIGENFDPTFNTHVNVNINTEIQLKYSSSTIPRPKLAHIAIYGAGNNLETFLIDCEGEFAKMMNASDPAKGGVWFIDVPDAIWQTDQPLSINYWKDLMTDWNKTKKTIANKASEGPEFKMVSKGLKEFFGLHYRTGFVPVAPPNIKVELDFDLM